MSERAQTSGKAASKGAARLGLFARIALFFRQVVAELQEGRPADPAELFRYTPSCWCSSRS